MPESFYSNKTALNTLANIKNSGRICHAYLITGDAGLGKRTFAGLFAKTLLCKSPGLACGGCSSCVKVNSGNHPDITVISSKGGKNSIHIDAVRALKSDAYVLPNEGAYKIYIIEEAQSMSLSATNALLKLLEEPPAHAILLLTAPSASELLDTVVSRCVEIKLTPASQQQAADALVKAGADKDSAEIAAERSGGNIGLAKKILYDKDYDAVYRAAEKTAGAIANRSEYEILAAFSEYGKDRKRVKEILDVLCELARRALSVKCIPQPFKKSGEGDVCERLAGAYSLRKLVEIAEILSQTAVNIDKNANIALLLSYAAAQIKD